MTKLTRRDLGKGALAASAAIIVSTRSAGGYSL